MIDPRTAPDVALLFRLTLGGLFLAYASVRLFVVTPTGTARFGNIWLPPELADVVMTAVLWAGSALVLRIFLEFLPAGLRCPLRRSCSEPSIVSVVRTLVGDGNYALTISQGSPAAGELRARAETRSPRIRSSTTE